MTGRRLVYLVEAGDIVPGDLVVAVNTPHTCVKFGLGATVVAVSSGSPGPFRHRARIRVLLLFMDGRLTEYTFDESNSYEVFRP